jgi:hypothetical protein
VSKELCTLGDGSDGWKVRAEKAEAERDGLRDAINHPRVQEQLQVGILNAEDNVKWMTRSKESLEKDKGDPRKIKEHTQWIAEQVETIVALRALAAPPAKEGE